MRHLLNLLHGAVLLLAFYFAFAGMLYGREWVEEKWALVQIGPGVLILWMVSLVCWILFSIAGHAKVIPREDAGRVVDKWGKAE